MTVHLNNYVSKLLNSATKHLQIILCGRAHDIFALGAYYHQSCYIRFTYILTMSQSRSCSDHENEKIVSIRFCTYVKLKMWRKRNAHLLKELLEDVNNLYEEHDTLPFINDSKSLH